MMRIFSLIALLVASCAFVSADIPGDQITSLPGWNGALPQKMYSGLMAADSAKSVFLHYWFIESANNPATDPVVVWLNGGPGCSSLEGLLYEQGPLHFAGNSTGGVPNLVRNPFAWTNLANMIFLESPAGVGFSYYANGSTSTTDEITSQNNYAFIKNFFAAYSEYAANPFYITGESYAGIYVPTFARRIYEGAQSGDNKINFQGIAVGNGCWGNLVGTCAMYNPESSGYEGVAVQLEFLHGHAMVSEPHWITLMSACGNLSNPNPTQQCNDAINDALNDGGDYNVYDIYDECPAPVSARAPSAIDSWRKAHGLPSPKIQRKVRGPNVVDTCLGPELAENWLDNSDVQAALHISAANVSDWSACAGIDYTKTLGSALADYTLLVNNYRVMIYSGDVDSCVPFTGTEQWVYNLGFSVQTPWGPWMTADQQVAGYVTVFNSKSGFQLVTVKDAGHMVPQYQPYAALAMFTAFINNQPL